MVVVVVAGEVVAGLTEENADETVVVDAEDATV